MERNELLVGEVGYHLGVTTRIQRIRSVRKELLLAVPGHKIVWRGVGSLHLVEHDTFVGQGGVDGIDLVVPSLLFQDLAGQAGMEDRVQIDVNEVVEVLQVLAGDRVRGLVGKRHCIEERVE